MLKNVLLFFKGFSMGLANVVPGVSGGTIALLAGIFERFINALKSFDLEALKLLFRFKFKEFAKHTDLFFLLVLVLGELIAIVSASKLFEFLFKNNYGVFVWSFFFGLIIASVYYIAKSIKKFNSVSILLIIAGALAAVGFSLVTPATENDNPFYLVMCGAIAICDMLLPGISGSYTLILLGNYKLIMIDAVAHFRLGILLPVALGCAVGFIAFARLLSWLLKKYWNQTMSILSGFVAGSLVFIWPWKDEIHMMNGGIPVFDSKGRPVVEGYDWHLPDLNTNTFIGIALVVAGIVILCLIEELSKKFKKDDDSQNPADGAESGIA